MRETRLILKRLDAGGWQEFLTSGPTTLYHGCPWVSVLERTYGFRLWLASLRDHHQALACCLFAQPPFSRRLISLPFSDSCPPLSREPYAVDDLLGALAGAKLAINFEVRGVRARPPWETLDCFVKWELPLTVPLDELDKGLSENFRRNRRRAVREGIWIDYGDDPKLLRRFYALQLLSRRQFGLPPQPWKFFDLVREHFAPSGCFEVWVASYKHQDLAAAIFLKDGPTLHYKWGARLPGKPSSANHLLFWDVVELHHGRERVIDLGRTDVRNEGLMRFKRELGAVSQPLPVAYFPRAPKHASAETLTGYRATVSKLWQRLPLPVTEVAGRVMYRFLA